jgi:uncharacterized protein with HEPN domain
MRDDRERLRDIQEAISRIDKHAARGRGAFERDELIQNWIVHHLQLIGEATRHLSSELKDRHPEVPWAHIIGMRNILVHDYFAIDLEAVWQAVAVDLPELKRKVDALLKMLDT